MAHSPLAKIAIQNNSHQAYMERRSNHAKKEIEKILQDIERTNERVNILKDTIIDALGTQMAQVNNKPTKAQT